MNSRNSEKRIGDLNNTLEAVYDDYRTILLNKKYNGEKLAKTTRNNRASEILIAVGASGSGIAGLTLWKTDYGQITWGIISAIAILVSIIKPILNLGEDIEEYSQLWAEYSTLVARCRRVIQSIEGARSRIAETGDLPGNLGTEISNIRSKMVDLAPRGDQKPKRKRVEELQNEVNEEVPAAALWVAFAQENAND